jgi:GT2 family glycosyltransferase
MRLQGIKTTVVILNYFGEKYLRNLIERLAGEPVDVIVVDNCSTDRSGGEFKKANAANATYLSLNRNVGFARGNNIGALLAKTDYILFLNNDTLPEKGFVKKMERNMDEFDVVGAKLVFGETKEIPLVIDGQDYIFKTKKGEVQHAGVGYYFNYLPFEMGRGKDPKDPLVSKKKEVYSVTAACLMVKKDKFFDVGGFDTRYLNGWEDTDLCLRLKEQGARIVYDPEAVVTHYASSSIGRFDQENENKRKWIEVWHCNDRIAKVIPKDQLSTLE